MYHPPIEHPAEPRLDPVAGIAIVLVAALVLLPQLLTPGAYSCIIEDVTYYVNWTRQFSGALSEGVLYPRWMADAHAGFGNPTFVFYSPLMMYVTGILALVFGGLASAMAATKFLGLALSGITMYFYGAELAGRRAGIAAAIAYMALPFRWFDLYFIGVFQSKFALAFVPLCFWGAHRLVRRRPGVTILAIGWTLVCLTHLLSAYMVGLLVIVYLVLLAPHSLRYTVPRAGAALGIGVMCAGAYLLPVLAESHLVHLDVFRSEHWGRFENNFLFWIAGDKSPYNPPFYDAIARSVGTSFLAATALASANGLRRRDWRTAMTLLLLASLTVFLMADISAMLWAFLPGLEMVLFPTRWAIFGIFALSGVVGLSMSRQMRPLGLAIAAVFCLPGFKEVITAARSGCSFQEADLIAVDDQHGAEEYVPRHVDLNWLRQESKGHPPVSIVSGRARSEVITWQAHSRQIELDVEQRAVIRLRTFAYPGWQLHVDGEVAQSRIAPRSGAIEVDVDVGQHTLKMDFVPTKVRTAGTAVSIVGWGILFAMLWRRRRARPRLAIETNFAEHRGPTES